MRLRGMQLLRKRKQLREVNLRIKRMKNQLRLKEKQFHKEVLIHLGEGTSAKQIEEKIQLRVKWIDMQPE